MTAIEILNSVLNHTIDAPYTVEEVIPVSQSTVKIRGAYRLEHGLIEDQLTIGLRTYFRITDVTSSLNADGDGWIAYTVTLTRRPSFVHYVPTDLE